MNLRWLTLNISYNSLHNIFASKLVWKRYTSARSEDTILKNKRGPFYGSHACRDVVGCGPDQVQFITTESFPVPKSRRSLSAVVILLQAASLLWVGPSLPSSVGRHSAIVPQPQLRLGDSDNKGQFGNWRRSGRGERASRPCVPAGASSVVDVIIVHQRFRNFPSRVTRSRWGHPVI